MSTDTQEQPQELTPSELQERTGLSEEDQKRVVEQFKHEQEQQVIASDFVGQITQLCTEFQEKLPLSYMAKVCFSTAVDLITNQAAIQAHFTVKKALEEKESSRIVRA